MPQGTLGEVSFDGAQAQSVGQQLRRLKTVMNVGNAVGLLHQRESVVAVRRFKHLRGQRFDAFFAFAVSVRQQVKRASCAVQGAEQQRVRDDVRLVEHQQPAARLQNALHFRQRPLGRGKMMKRGGDGHEVHCGAPHRQLFGVPAQQRRLRAHPPRALQHAGGNVQTHQLTRWRQLPRQKTRSRCHVQHNFPLRLQIAQHRLQQRNLLAHVQVHIVVERRLAVVIGGVHVLHRILHNAVIRDEMPDAITPGVAFFTRRTPRPPRIKRERRVTVRAG